MSCPVVQDAHVIAIFAARAVPAGENTVTVPAVDDGHVRVTEEDGVYGTTEAAFPVPPAETVQDAPRVQVVPFTVVEAFTSPAFAKLALLTFDRFATVGSG